MRLVVSDRRNIVIGESNKCRCFDWGITIRIEKNATVCIHQFAFQAALPTGNTRHPNKYVTMSAVMRIATRPEVAESFPRAFGLSMNRRKESPVIPAITAKAHAAAKVPYQP